MLPQGTLLLRSWEGKEIILRKNGRYITSPAGQGTPRHGTKSAAGCCLLLSSTCADARAGASVREGEVSVSIYQLAPGTEAVPGCSEAEFQ